MLTKAQVQRLAQRHNVGMQVQERDYLQHLFLWRLYTRSQELVFKGGTALRLVYHGNRRSWNRPWRASRAIGSGICGRCCPSS